MKGVCDKLIEIFWIEKPEPDQWRKLLAYSEEWAKIRPHFHARIQARAKEHKDPGKQAELFRLARRLKDVDDEMVRHNELLAAVEQTPQELDAIVARRRRDFTTSFFYHIKTLVDANAHDPIRQQERNLVVVQGQSDKWHRVEGVVAKASSAAAADHKRRGKGWEGRSPALAGVATSCATAVDRYDQMMDDEVALESAQAKFDDILAAPTLGDACKKIDELASKRQLDSTLMLLITKAWSAAKESTMMKEEVKDIMFHLYKSAHGNMQRLVPKEVRILRHILSFDDPSERMAALTDAFSPGSELEGETVDTLYTREGTLMKEAQQLMNPAVIQRMEGVKALIQDEFM
eukprot:jgi/Mesen1/1403/ME000130S00491